jgi:catechol 2,3-dioxygenase-like lactoylglutathione lyase family enzyme
MRVGTVYHTGFTVSDIERSVSFYRDVLGMRLIRRQTGTAPYLATITGFEGVRLEIAMLQPADGGSMLELLQYASHPAPPTDRATNRPGNGHLCFKVDDVRAACGELRRRGVTLVSEPAEITAGAHAGGLAVYLRDPDGFTVELYQGPPARPPEPGATAITVAAGGNRSAVTGETRGARPARRDGPGGTRRPAAPRPAPARRDARRDG